MLATQCVTICVTMWPPRTGRVRTSRTSSRRAEPIYAYRAGLTRKRSLVQIRYRPPVTSLISTAFATLAARLALGSVDLSAKLCRPIARRRPAVLGSGLRRSQSGSEHDAAWSAAQNDLATLSTNSVHRVIDGATHQVVIVNEEDSAATTQAILDVVSSVRSAGRLVR